MNATKQIIFSFICLIIYTNSIFANYNNTIIDRVIVSSNENLTYLEFWPLVAQAWKKMGIKPTLALIADKNLTIDETLGDVIRLEPIPGIPTSFYAQVIRLLLPLYFEDEFCLISDIDMIPLNAAYFNDAVREIDPTHFVVFRNKGYFENKFPMCYNAALGKTFKEIFGIAKEQIPQLVRQWYHEGFGWDTDEIMLYRSVTTWPHFNDRCTLLNHEVRKRIDRSFWKYNEKLLADHWYIDAHCLRPYSKHKKEIDRLLKIARIVE